MCILLRKILFIFSQTISIKVRVLLYIYNSILDDICATASFLLYYIMYTYVICILFLPKLYAYIIHTIAKDFWDSSDLKKSFCIPTECQPEVLVGVRKRWQSLENDDPLKTIYTSSQLAYTKTHIHIIQSYALWYAKTLTVMIICRTIRKR